MRYSIFIMTFFTIILLFNSCNSSSGDELNFCNSEVSAITSRLKSCNVEEPNFYKNKNYNCGLYKNEGVGFGNVDSYNQCLKEIDSLSCSELKALSTKENLKSIPHCFDYPKYTKKEICESNVLAYCNDFIFEECGYDKLPEYCHATGTHKNDEGNGHDVLDLDISKIKDYCSTTVNADDELKNIYDFFSYTCFSWYRDNLDCNNIQEIDFRNDDWKTQCSQ